MGTSFPELGFPRWASSPISVLVIFVA